MAEPAQALSTARVLVVLVVAELVSGVESSMLYTAVATLYRIYGDPVVKRFAPMSRQFIRVIPCTGRVAASLTGAILKLVRNTQTDGSFVWHAPSLIENE